MTRRFVITVLRVLLGAVFVCAGAVKIRATADFADAIGGFRLLPPGMNNLLALGLPPFETLLGVWLIVGRRRRAAAFCALTLSGIFLLALASAALRGIAVDCGCFGATSSTLSAGQRLWLSIGRDTVLLMVAATLYAAAWKDSRP